MKKLYDELIAKNGLNNQITVAIEEHSELIKELTKFLRGKGDKMRIIEELGDVEIVNEQIQQALDITREQINVFKTFKLKRLEAFYIKENVK